MRVTFLKSAGVVLESGATRLVCDPWLEDGAYYGAWAHVPPCTVTPEDLAPVHGIYITHIHPDHLHAASLARFPRDVPVYVHRYAWTYLADELRRMGFTPVELANGETAEVGNLALTIYAADFCDPAVCGRFFGCDAYVGAPRPGSTQIDSLAVVTDGAHTVVNVNDCPVGLAQHAAPDILTRFGRPDFLLVNYVGAGPYPQCMVALTEAERLVKAAAKREQFLRQAQDFIELFRPRAFLPFAGTYTLVGRLARLNPFRGCPTQREAADVLGHRIPWARAVYLDSGQTYDLASGAVTGEPCGWTDADCRAYERDVLAHRRLDYEDEPEPGRVVLLQLLDVARRRFLARCEATGFRTETRVYVDLGESCYRLADGALVAHETARTEPHLVIGTDPRLLVWLLTGRAHWGDASIGSHLTFERRPDVFERGLYFCLDDLHV